MAVKKTATANAATPVAAAEPAKKAATRRRRKVTHEMIETRAYLISLTNAGGSPFDNWLAAERELLSG